jgi:pseudomonalisin
MSSLPDPSRAEAGPSTRSGATRAGRRHAAVTPTTRNRLSFARGAGAALLAASAAAGLTAATASGAGATPQRAAAPSSSATLTEDVLPGLPLLTPQPAPAGTVLHVGVAIAEPDPSGEAAYESALYDPSSPEYHEFLTPASFAARFGVATSMVQAVRSWLTGGGLQVTEVPGAGNWIQASGTVAQVESLMDVQIGSYSSKGVPFLANESAPTVPAGDSITTVVGLNTLQKFSVPQTPVGQVTPPPVPTSTGCLPSCVYTPQDMWSMYDMPATDQGEGQTMAVFGEGQTADVISNLRAFENAMSLPQVPITVDDVGAGPFTDDSGQVEWDLDTQASTGMSPDVLGETLYFASSLADADVESAFTAWVNDPNGPLQANASFGECETDPGNAVWNAVPPEVGQFAGDGDNLEPVAEATLEQATLEGRTLFAAAGDTGSSCPLAALPVIGAGNGVLNQGQPMLNYPCASDYAVCVGGTVLYSDGNTPPARNLEYSWPYTGGGSALFQAEPSWQAGVSAIDHPCIVDPSGSPYPTGTICRGAPDVAAMSGDIATNAYDIYEDGTASTEGGTSLSSPLWVGMWTRVQAAAPAGGLGFADPTFYGIGTGHEGDYAKDFFDVTLGTNGLYQAGTGWDYTSGWGVPDVANLTQDLDGTLEPTDNVRPAPPESAAATLPCGLLWQDAAHTASDTLGNSDPQLSLVQGSMGTADGVADLAVRMQVEDLSSTLPTGATGEDWYTTWTYGGTTYFAQAQLEATPGSSVTYSDGTVDVTGTEHDYSPAHTDTGSFTPGTDGVIEVDVPFANIGSPPLKSVLSQPASATYTEEGVPGAVSSLQPVDSGGPTLDYAVGQPTLCLSEARGSVTYGDEQAAAFTATLTPAPGAAAPTGTVTVEDLSGGTPTAVCTISTFTSSDGSLVGSCSPAASEFGAGQAFGSVVASYPGDSNDAPATSTPYLAFSVAKATSSTTLTLSTTTVTVGHENALRISFAVVPEFSGAPTGTVVVSAGSKALCSVALASGKGACTLGKSALGAGTYALTAAYPGDPNFIVSSSGARALKVKS